MTPWILAPTDIAFALFLAGFDIARFSDEEFRIYRSFVLRRTA